MRNIKRFFELNNINEYNTKLFCNNIEYKSFKKGEEIFEKKSDYRNFCIILKGKVMVNLAKMILEYNNEEINNIFEDKNDLEKSNKEGIQRQTIKFERKTFEYSNIEYSNSEYFSRKICRNDKRTINSVIALEDTDLLILDHRIYDNIFFRAIARERRDRKNFILNNIKTLKELAPSRFEMFINKVELNVNKNKNI
jgi:hypothetical protein